MAYIEYILLPLLPLKTLPKLLREFFKLINPQWQCSEKKQQILEAKKHERLRKPLES